MGVVLERVGHDPGETVGHRVEDRLADAELAGLVADGLVRTWEREDGIEVATLTLEGLRAARDGRAQ